MCVSIRLYVQRTCVSISIVGDVPHPRPCLTVASVATGNKLMTLPSHFTGDCHRSKEERGLTQAAVSYTIMDTGPSDSYVHFTTHTHTHTHTPPSPLPPSPSPSYSPLSLPIPSPPNVQCQVMDHPCAYKCRCVCLSCKYKLCHLSGSRECREQQHCSSTVTKLPNSFVQRMAWNMEIHSTVPGKLVLETSFWDTRLSPNMCGFSPELRNSSPNWTNYGSACMLAD